MPSQSSTSNDIEFTPVQRFKFWIVSLLVTILLRFLGITLKVEFTRDPSGLKADFGDFPQHIFPFWHRCVLPATYIFRNQKLSVMTSQSTDGEYIARVISNFGFIPVRGSSSRGGTRALMALRETVEQGGAAVFTIDGPRGPRYVAKRGPVLLAAMTGVPIVPFYVAVKDAWILNSWDRFVIPKPFSRVHIALGSSIHVPPGISGDDQVEEYRLKMQAELEHVTRVAEEKLGITPL